MQGSSVSVCVCVMAAAVVGVLVVTVTDGGDAAAAGGCVGVGVVASSVQERYLSCQQLATPSWEVANHPTGEFERGHTKWDTTPTQHTHTDFSDLQKALAIDHRALDLRALRGQCFAFREGTCILMAAVRPSVCLYVWGIRNPRRCQCQSVFTSTYIVLIPNAISRTDPYLLLSIPPSYLILLSNSASSIYLSLDIPGFLQTSISKVYMYFFFRYKSKINIRVLILGTRMSTSTSDTDPNRYIKQ
ncbi:hypothetical protein DFH27DRAFT_521688 [Peziza echinospora]|nr:hypothetical protein DFH27DRAFT_521688 [Peziza echinospora]